MIRRTGAALAAGVLGWAVLAGAAAGAGAQTDPVFDPEDARDLAALLAEATDAQDVCYGWTVQVADVETRSQSQSTGSNFGPGRSLDIAGSTCRYVVEFTADIVYARASSDFDDSVSWSVTSRPPGGPGKDDLDRLGLFDQGDLAGEDPDVAVSRAVAALPQLAADAGIAAPLTAVPAPSAPPDVGSLADSPGSDYLRRTGGLLAFGGVLLAGGLAFGAFALYSSRSRRQPSRLHQVPPTGTSAPPGPAPDSPPGPAPDSPPGPRPQDPPPPQQ
ncbi:MAG: hypothetical protein ACRDTE_21220 [Pseudonocardiaceae bacterium]